MKRTLAFAVVFSTLTATAAFASPQTVTSVAYPLVAESGSDRLNNLHNQSHDARVVDNDSNQTFNRLSSNPHGNVFVAENRKEFGSKYQRY